MKTVRNLVHAGTFFLASLLPLKLANAQENIFNPFIRQNVLSENYYGSGDVNDDGKVDWEDVGLMQKGLINDFTDIDGDSTLSKTDLQLLEDHLNNGTILPGDWNNLETREQREDWLKKMLAIDKTDERQPVLEAGTQHGQGGSRKTFWVFHHYATQIYLSFFGYTKTDENYNVIPEKFNTKDIGRFNLPVHYVSVDSPEWFNHQGWFRVLVSSDHSINCILVGDNPLNFNDWYFFEPQTDRKIFIGYWDMPINCKISIMTIKNFWKDSGALDTFYGDIIANFEIKDGIPELTYQNKHLILTRPEPQTFVAEEEPVEFTLEQNYPNPFNPTTTIEYNLPQDGYVILSIYNTSGQKITVLTNEYQTAGNYFVTWDATGLPSGLYFCTLKANGFTETMKMLLMK